MNTEDLSWPEQTATKPSLPLNNDTENDKCVAVSDNDATEDQEEQFSIGSDHEEKFSADSDHEPYDAVVEEVIEESSCAEELGSSCNAMLFQNCPLTVNSSLL